MGANDGALIQSIPVAVVAATQVITIDYRQGPENKFPAVSEDVIAVYRELLKESHSENIGLFGCSAGGALAAMTVAGLQIQNAPRPGAIGIFSSGAYGDWNGDPAAKGTSGGDSRYWAGPFAGQPALPVKMPVSRILAPPTRAYITDVSPSDPLVSPAESPAILAKFPPTLLMLGTRAYDMSAVVETHRQLTKNGVQADLHLWDGMDHCFFFDVGLPESKEAYEVIAKFFNQHLGRK